MTLTIILLYVLHSTEIFFNKIYHSLSAQPSAFRTCNLTLVFFLNFCKGGKNVFNTISINEVRIWIEMNKIKQAIPMVE